MKIIELFFDSESYNFHFTLNIWVLLIVLALIFIINELLRRHSKSSKSRIDVQLTKIKYKIFGVDFEYEIKKSYLNIEIAHRIHIELITREAAIPFDEKNDVIVQVYDSWYKLFDVTRGELKKITGDLILDESSGELVKLLTDILNQGLRPHLTEYQADFRKWYKNQLSNDENKIKSPQDLQRQYPKYQQLISSMKDVNDTLIDYNIQLKTLWGKKP